MFCFSSCFLDMCAITECVQSVLAASDVSAKLCGVEWLVLSVEFGFGLRMDGPMLHHASEGSLWSVIEFSDLTCGASFLEKLD